MRTAELCGVFRPVEGFVGSEEWAFNRDVLINAIA